MTRKHIIISLIFSALVIIAVSMSGIVDASPLAQATNTPRATRDRTKNPRATKTSEATAEATAHVTATSETVSEDSENSALDPLTSQLLIINSDRNDVAKVTVNVYDANGDIAFSDEIKIKENGAKILEMPKGVGDDFLGSARIVSDRRVQALVLSANRRGSTSDVYQVNPTSSRALTLPYLAHLASNAQNSLLAIQNVSSVTADANVSAYDLDGNEVTTHPLTIPARASVYLNTTALFGANSFVGSARITANQSLAAAELVMLGQETASLHALNANDEGSDQVVPLVERARRKDGTIKTWTELYVRNNGAAATDITVAFYNRKGEVKGSVTRANVPAGGVAVFSTRESEFEFLSKKFSGWANVTSLADTPLAIHSLGARASGKQWFGGGAVENHLANARNVCGVVSSTGNQRSVITLVNMHADKKAKVQVRLFAGEDGAQVKTIELQVAPHAQTKITPKNGLPLNFQGLSVLTSEGQSSRELVVQVTTQMLDGRRARSVSGYVCR